MIKLFRKTGQRLLGENKIGTYLINLIREIVFVVIGILIALSIKNWNSNRLLQKKEVKYIMQIHEEFIANRTQLDVAAAYHLEVYDNTIKILDLMPIDTNTIDKDSLSFYLSKTFNNFTFNPQQSAINSLTNSSSFGIISNPELRSLLQNWDEMVNDYNEEEINSKEYSFTVYFPYLREHIAFINFGNSATILNHPKINFAFLNDLEFENIIFFRKELSKDIINRPNENELKKISQAINRIIELTASENEK